MASLSGSDGPWGFERSRAQVSGAQVRRTEACEQRGMQRHDVQGCLGERAACDWCVFVDMRARACAPALECEVPAEPWRAVSCAQSCYGAQSRRPTDGLSPSEGLDDEHGRAAVPAHKSRRP